VPALERPHLEQFSRLCRGEGLGELIVQICTISVVHLILCRSRDVKARKDGFVLNELAGPGVCSRAAPREEALGSRKPPVRAQTPARAYGPIRTMANLVTIYI
jgi:hypothetical protein